MRPVIIYPPTIDWDLLHQRPQQLLKSLSESGNTCIFCNINLQRRHPKGIIPYKLNLLLSNNLSFRETVQWARAAYPSQPIVAYFTYPPQITTILESKVDLVIFDSVDEPADEFASWLPLYSEAVQRADVVVATAQSLVARAQSIIEKEVHFLPNGCDYQHFKKAQTPRHIEEEPFTKGKPIIGYIGAIAPWLDTSLINTMARCLSDYEFVFIGSLLGQKWAAFPNSNMHYLRHKDYSELPNYLSNFSYCLIPFRITKMTKGVNPIKYWEYLASGIPILSTPLPEVNPEFVTTITEDMFPSFSPSVSIAGREERILLACDNSWTNRARSLSEIIRAKLECG